MAGPLFTAELLDAGVLRAEAVTVAAVARLAAALAAAVAAGGLAGSCGTPAGVAAAAVAVCGLGTFNKAP